MVWTFGFILIVTLCKLTQADFEFTCDENIVTVTPPVVNETTYEYKVLISVESKNVTLDAYEKSDLSNGSIVLFVHYPSNTTWVTEMINHDYKHNQTFHIVGDWDDQTCKVYDLMNNETYSIFGMGIEDGFKNPEFSFKWTGDYNYTKGNDTIINGIPADKYSTCLLFNNSQMKYDVDLYFSRDDWDVVDGQNVPLMVVLKVNSTVNGDFKTEKYTYSFTSYHKNSSRGHPMYFPNDVICEGRKDMLPFPTMGNNYAVTEEIIKKDTKKIFSWRQHFNYDEKLYRVDFVAPKNSSKSIAPTLYHHHYTLIHDFHAGVEYLIDKEVGNCVVSPITNKPMWRNFDVALDPTHPGFYRMRNEVDFVKAMNMTYTGRHTSHRTGMTLNTWTSAVPHKINGTAELRETFMFTTPDWSNGDSSPVAVGVKLSMKFESNGTTKKTDLMIHLSDILPLGHGIHAYDIGMCQNSSTKKRFVLKFSDTYAKYLSNFSVQIDVATQNAVALAAKVSKIRVSSYSSKEIAPDRSSGKDNAASMVFITVTLYDQPSFHGNTSEYLPGINLTEAVSNLEKAVRSNSFRIDFQLQTTGEKISMTAFPNYFVESNDLYSPPPSSGPNTKKGLSNGAIAALCLAMALVGFIVGAALCHFRYKRGNRQFGYGIQD